MLANRSGRNRTDSVLCVPVYVGFHSCPARASPSTKIKFSLEKKKFTDFFHFFPKIQNAHTYVVVATGRNNNERKSALHIETECIDAAHSVVLAESSFRCIQH